MTDMIVSQIDTELSADDVRERFAWARRNGFANWLWPDIAIEDWRAAMTDIVDATRRLLAGDCCALTCDNAKAVCLAGYTSGIGPLLGYWIEQSRLCTTPEIKTIMRLQLSHNRDRVARFSQIALKVMERFSVAGITPLIFKGMHTAFVYFPDPGVRPMSDIDIYIPPAVMARAENMLRDLGYERTTRMRDPYRCNWMLPADQRNPRTLMYVHRDDPLTLDVQGSLDRRLPTRERVNFDRLMTCSGSDVWPLSVTAEVPCQPLLALHLAAHISEHLSSATLIRVAELVLVIRRDCQAGRLKWDQFLAGAKTIGGVRFVYPALFFCEQLAPETVPADVLAVCRAGARANLRHLLATLTIATAQPLGRHSLHERFMWADNWRACASQLVCELGFDGQGQPIGQTLYNYGTKLFALCRGRMTA